MARVLIVGGGCRGRKLARVLLGDGHTVRMTTRHERSRADIEQTGAECWIGDPDVVGSLRYALDGVTVMCWALGTAAGEPDAVRPLHDTRLEMMLTNVIDSTVRGVIYEASGTVDRAFLDAGEQLVRRAAQRSLIPFEVLRAPPDDADAWTAQARSCVEVLLSGGQSV